MSSKRNDLPDDVPGNTIESQRRFDQWVYKQGKTLLDAENILEHAYDREVDVRRIAIAMPTMDKPEFLIVATGFVDGLDQVAFHNAPTLHEAFVGFFERLKNGSLKWKPDTYKKR